MNELCYENNLENQKNLPFHTFGKAFYFSMQHQSQGLPWLWCPDGMVPDGIFILPSEQNKDSIICP